MTKRITKYQLELTEEECLVAERAIKDALKTNYYTGHDQIIIAKILRVIRTA